MKKAGKWIVLLIVAALLVLIAMRFMKKKEVVEEETRPTVAVGLPETRDIINLTTAIGTIEPQEEVSVMPKMAGEITAVNFAVGDVVEEGQVLITIHSDALDSLRIQVDSAKIAMNDAQTALSRTEALFATGAVSQQQLESAQSAAKSFTIRTSVPVKVKGASASSKRSGNYYLTKISLKPGKDCVLTAK